MKTTVLSVEFHSTIGESIGVISDFESVKLVIDGMIHYLSSDDIDNLTQSFKLALEHNRNSK